MNRYQGTLKVGSTYQKVYVEASNGSIAKKMFDQLYGDGNVINVCQVS